MKHETKYVLQVAGVFRKDAESLIGAFLHSFDHDAKFGLGEGSFSRDPQMAKRFDNKEAALEFWRRPSKLVPTRLDGKPNRPLTAVTMAIEPVAVIWVYTSADGTMWDMDRIATDAKAGKFGEPVVIPTELVPPANYANGNLDRDRIEWIKQHPEVLDAPGIGIGSTKPGYLISTIADGNHRGTARQELGLPTISYYVVPVALERDYRTSRDEIARWKADNMPMSPAT